MCGMYVNVMQCALDVSNKKCFWFRPDLNFLNKLSLGFDLAEFLVSTHAIIVIFLIFWFAPNQTESRRITHHPPNQTEHRTSLNHTESALIETHQYESIWISTKQCASRHHIITHTRLYTYCSHAKRCTNCLHCAGSSDFDFFRRCGFRSISISYFLAPAQILIS